MVIENQIPKTETVYELKDEYKVPSFEEFMETYEADEGIIDSYNAELGSYGDAGIPKASGPCYYSNADCTHFTPEGWIQLYLGCPAVECGELGRNFSTWVHASCEYPIYISKNLEIKCINCQNPSNMLNWNFNCFSSKHKGGYRETNYEIFANALILIGGKARNRDPRIKDIVKIISDKLWNMSS